MQEYQDGINLTKQELYDLRARVISRHNILPAISRAHSHGELKSLTKGRGIEFAEVRQYSDGDDIRSIDWKVSAKTNNLHTKLYHEEHAHDIYLAIDLSPSMHFGSKKALKSIVASKIATYLAWLVLEQQFNIFGITMHQQKYLPILGKNNKHRIANLITTLAKLSYLKVPLDNSIPSLQSKFTYICKHAPKQATVFYIGDFYQYKDIERNMLAQLGKKCQLIAIHIYDPMEAKLPAMLQLSASNGDDIVMLNANNKTVLSKYRDEFNTKINDLQQQFITNKAMFWSISTYEDVCGVITSLIKEKPYVRASGT